MKEAPDFGSPYNDGMDMWTTLGILETLLFIRRCTEMGYLPCTLVLSFVSILARVLWGREFRLANSHGAKVKLMVFTVNLPEVPEILGNI